MTAAPVSCRFAALGTTVVFCASDPNALEAVGEIVRSHVEALDVAASRFRTDSELVKLNNSRGSAVQVSDLLFEAILDALGAAAATGGVVSPTVGEAMRIVGYDRDFSEVKRTGGPLLVRIAPIPGWSAIQLDAARKTVELPAGVELDLGATAKAACADRAARAAADATGSGALVSLGGDVSVAGPAPEDGWAIRIADRHDAPAGIACPIVAIRHGGVATSGTSARRWQRGGRLLHHMIDPATGLSARTCWRTVSVAAPSCLEANTASTAAVILGSAAPAWLAQRGHHARLVREDDTVVRVGQWPAEERFAAPESDARRAS